VEVDAKNSPLARRKESHVIRSNEGGAKENKPHEKVTWHGEAE